MKTTAKDFATENTENPEKNKKKRTTKFTKYTKKSKRWNHECTLMNTNEKQLQLIFHHGHREHGGEKRK